MAILRSTTIIGVLTVDGKIMVQTSDGHEYDLVEEIGRIRGLLNNISIEGNVFDTIASILNDLVAVHGDLNYLNEVRVPSILEDISYLSGDIGRLDREISEVVKNKLTELEEMVLSVEGVTEEQVAKLISGAISLLEIPNIDEFISVDKFKEHAEDANMHLSKENVVGIVNDTVSVIEGPPGEDGLSAFELAVLNGFIGTEEEWLESLVGPPGSGVDSVEWEDVQNKPENFPPDTHNHPVSQITGNFQRFKLTEDNGQPPSIGTANLNTAMDSGIINIGANAVGTPTPGTSGVAQIWKRGTQTSIQFFFPNSSQSLFFRNRTSNNEEFQEIATKKMLDSVISNLADTIMLITGGGGE